MFIAVLHFVFFTFVIFLVMGFLWSLLEVAVYGDSQPRVVDDIVGIILAILIYHVIWG